MEYKHSKVKTSTPQDDGSVVHTSQSYYDKLSYEKIEVEKKLTTSQQTLLKDIISCLEHISNGADELTLKIEASRGTPKRITKTWVQSKQHYNRR